MTSVLAPPGKYRMRKDWSTNSIPQSVEEEVIASPRIIINNSHNYVTETNLHQHHSINGMGTFVSGVPPKAPRRSSLALNLLTGRKDNNKDTNGKRRSSIAVAFFGRKDKNENIGKRAASIDLEAELEAQVALSLPQMEEKEKKRRRSSWQNKLERRRRKGVSVGGENVDFDMNGDGYVRQKRHSWWTIFVPDNLKSR